MCFSIFDKMVLIKKIITTSPQAEQQITDLPWIANLDQP